MCEHVWGYAGREGITAAAALAVGCEGPYWLRCSSCDASRLVRCGRPSVRVCEPCGLRHKSRVHRVAASGFHVGRSGLFVTVTAPSWVEHFMPSGDACACTGGDCPDLASWNAGAAKRWNRLLQDLGRALGHREHDKCAAWKECRSGSARYRMVGAAQVHKPCGRMVPLPVDYFKAAETQRRGALHFHALLRSDTGAGSLVIGKALLRRLAVKHGFGHEVDVQAVEPKHWGYVAKYASKAASERSDVPWSGLRWVGGHRFEDHVDRTTGEVCRVKIGKDREQVPSSRPTYRTWSASRDFGDSMRYVREAQGHWSAVVAALPSWGDREGVPASWSCVVVPVRSASG